MTHPVAVFRCDAGPAIGAGHVMRCLALAEEFVAVGKRVVFAVREGTRESVPLLHSASIEFVDLKGPAESEASEIGDAVDGHCDFLVVDHYGRDGTFESDCRKWASNIIVLDDQTGRHHECDVLVDSGVTEAAVYASLVPPSARVLAGPSFALLRRIIVARREEANRRRDGRPVKNVLISVGATDPTNATGTLLDKLAESELDFDVTVAISGRAPHLKEVREKIGGRTRLAIDADLSMLVVHADLAIGAAGLSAFERACLGLPSVLLVVANNQRGIADAMVNSGAALALDPIEIETMLLPALEMLCGDAQLRMSMGRKAAKLVDGRGSRRVLDSAMMTAS